jgi:hypothetical protein
MEVAHVRSRIGGDFIEVARILVRGLSPLQLAHACEDDDANEDRDGQETQADHPQRHGRPPRLGHDLRPDDVRPDDRRGLTHLSQDGHRHKIVVKVPTHRPRNGTPDGPP